jgi:hypothetical protein
LAAEYTRATLWVDLLQGSSASQPTDAGTNANPAWPRTWSQFAAAPPPSSVSLAPFYAASASVQVNLRSTGVLRAQIREGERRFAAADAVDASSDVVPVLPEVQRIVRDAVVRAHQQLPTESARDA